MEVRPHTQRMVSVKVKTILVYVLPGKRDQKRVGHTAWIPTLMRVAEEEGVGHDGS